MAFARKMPSLLGVILVLVLAVQDSVRSHALTVPPHVLALPPRAHTKDPRLQRRAFSEGGWSRSGAEGGCVGCFGGGGAGASRRTKKKKEPNRDQFGAWRLTSGTMRLYGLEASQSREPSGRALGRKESRLLQKHLSDLKEQPAPVPELHRINYGPQQDPSGSSKKAEKKGLRGSRGRTVSDEISVEHPPTPKAAEGVPRLRRVPFR